MPEVELSHVSKRYEDAVALDDVSLRVADGEYFCVIGPSGSGKSTLLKVVAGIVRQDEGRVYIGGEPVDDLPVEERGVALMFQEIYLFPHMDVWENVTYSPSVRGAEPEVVRRIGLELTDALGLALDRRAMPGELSLGAQQRVALARALASGADLLLLDEPLGSLDPRSAVELRRELRRLVKGLRLTVIHVTHSQEEAMAVADRIAVMRRGKVMQVGTPEELYFRPASPFVARFIGGECNFLEGTVVGEEGGLLVVDVGGLVVKCTARGRVGGRVVVAVRPEFVELSKVPSPGSWRGKVLDRSFMGSYVRYSVRLECGVELVAKSPPTEALEVGGEIYLRVRWDRAIAFEYPREGLSRAVAYE